MVSDGLTSETTRLETITMTVEVVADREVELHRTEIEPVRVRVLPNGHMDSNIAAKYVGRPTDSALIIGATGGAAPLANGWDICAMSRDPVTAAHSFQCRTGWRGLGSRRPLGRPTQAACARDRQA